MCLPPAPPRRKRRQWARSSRQHALRPDVPDTPHHRNASPRTTTPKPSSTTPQTPHVTRMSPACHRGGLHFEQSLGGFCDHRPLHGHATLALPTKHSGGFATIDPRHADDTPQSSAYGSNSPQATDKDKPHHQDNWTRMSNTTHATTPPQTSATASPTETPPAPPSQTPQHHTETQPRPNRRPLHPKHPMSPACHRGGLHFEQSLGGFCDHRPLHGHATLALPTKHSGGFATIDPRHADDTPQRSAYGSNSPHRAQASPARVGT